MRRNSLVSSEVAPFAKAGGLGDVSAALPRQLGANGHDVRIVMPMYSRVHAHGRNFTEVVPEIPLSMGPHRVHVSVYATELPGTQVPVYFIRCPSLYDRPSIYGNGDDEHLRFGVLSWAALKLCQYLQFAPDVVHCNDWQTGIVPLLLKSLFAWDRLFADTRSVLTIHNLGHQGTFGAHAAHEVGLGHCIDQVHQDELNAGRFGFMLTGLLHAHALTTVSPTYAREIETQDHGVGLDPYLRARRESLFGILNGIDDTEWNPEADHLPARYCGYLSGKARCKEALCHTMHLPYMPDVPVVGIVSRLAWQKGFDLCVDAAGICCATGACSSWCSARENIGTRRSSTTWRARSRNGRSSLRVQRTQGASHRGRKRFVPDALALRTLRPEPALQPALWHPAHRASHGRPGRLRVALRGWPAGWGTGFVFDHFDGLGMHWALNHALDAWHHGRTPEGAGAWHALQQRGMGLPLGWQHRVGEYMEVYKMAGARIEQGPGFSPNTPRARSP